MAGFFLFHSSLTDDGASCLLQAQAAETQPEFRFFSFSEIRELQASHPLTIVINTFHSRLHRLEMPLLNEKKARTAIPFALEDKLSKPMDSYHFAFSRMFYHQGHYLVVSIEKAFMEQLLQPLQNANIHCRNITLDWFALKENESALLNDQLLIYHKDFQGSLSEEVARIFLEQQPLETVYCFSDSADWSLPCSNKESTPSAKWIANRLNEQGWINIAQGEFKQGDKSIPLKKWFVITGGLVALWALLWLSSSLYKIHHLNKEIEITDKQIAKIYQKYFPGAKKIINPKFRLTQLFKSNKPAERQQLWFIMAQLSHTLQSHQIKVQRFVFQNRQLTITLLSPDFNQLEEFERKLESKGVKVKQTQAGNSKEGIIATLELS